MKTNNKPILSIIIVLISFLSASAVNAQILKNVEFKSNDLIQGSIMKGGTILRLPAVGTTQQGSVG